MPPGDTTAAQPDRSYCQLLGWKVFAPGYHNRELYTPARVATVPANFAALRGFLTPTGKLGHDRQQRLLRQVGFPNVGHVTRCDPTPDGGYEIDLDRVPVDVGEVVNAGWLNSGSVELKENVRDPRDPGKTLPGDVLVAVALLGEEQPALPGMSVPTATYPDGTPVPPAPRMPGWLAALADVTRAMAAEPDPEPGRRVVCFSAMFQEPKEVNKSDIIAAAKRLPPADQAEIVAALGAAGGGTPGTPASAPGGPAGGSGDLASFTKRYRDDREADRKCLADLTARLGAMEADRTKQTGADADKEEKQFSAEVARVVDAAVRAGHVQPWQKAAFITHGKSLARGRAFGAGASGASEFAAWAEALAGGPVAAFSDRVADAPAPGYPALTPGGRAVLDALRVTNPRVAERLG